MVGDDTSGDRAATVESEDQATAVESEGQATAPATEDPTPADAVTLAPPAAPAGAASTGVGTPAPSNSFETPSVLAPAPDYSEAGVPSLDFVRDKIEGRFAKSLGSTELAQEAPEARSAQEQAAKRADAAKEKLDAIRRSLRGD